METELVSIIMPAYNGEKYIRHAIESVSTQTYTRWELIIVDDGSTDLTARIAEEYLDSRIKLIRQRNSGEAAARNTALNHAKGEFVAFLDADDLYLPDHLETGVGYLMQSPHTDAVYADGFYIDAVGNRLQTLSSRRRGPFSGNIFEEVVYSSNVFGPPACVILRIKPIRDNGLRFDENIIIGPDWDFFIKYASVATFGFVGKSTCLYRLHTTNISIRVGLEKRALELAKVRLNSVKMENFRTCSIRTRIAVFYDLLVILLLGFPERQAEIVAMPEFTALPDDEQSRLLRLMASKAQLFGKNSTHVRDWLDKSRQLNPGDWASGVLWILYQIHPRLCTMLLRIKDFRQVDPRIVSPYVDMKLGKVS